MYVAEPATYIYPYVLYRTYSKQDSIPSALHFSAVSNPCPVPHIIPYPSITITITNSTRTLES